MEEYRRIWEKANRRTEDEEFVFSDEIWKKYYTTSKILNNTFRSVVEFCADEADTSNEKTNAAKRDQNLRQLFILYRKKIKWNNPNERRYLNVHHPIANCPQKSLMDHIQHEIYCYLYEKLSRITSRPSPLTKEENKFFNILHQKVLQERPLFYKHVESMWPKHKERCHIIHPEIKKYVDTVWKQRLSSVNTYPQKYCGTKMVPLVFSGSTKLVRALPSPKEVLSSGIAARYIPPCYGNQLKVSTDYDEIAAIFPPENFAKKIPVSRDKTAQDIVTDLGPDVVISISGLKCIMDNFSPEYDKEWDIPIVVREEKLPKTPNYNKKVVYIDKPFPPRNMSSMDKNKWYHKYGVRALLCRPRTRGSWKLTVPVSVDSKNASPTKSTQNTPAEQPITTENKVKSNSPDPVSKESDDTSVESSGEEDLYPSDSSTDKLVIACSDDDSTKEHQSQKKRKITSHSAPNSNQTKKPVKRIKSQSSDRSENEPCDNQNLNASSPKQIKTYGKQPKKDALGISDTAISAVQEPLKLSASNSGIVPEKEKHTSEDLSQRPNIMSQFSVSYKLWKLMLEKDSQEEIRASFLKGESSYRPIRILVRSKQRSVKITNGEVRPVTLASKLEYQSGYGMELSTMSEICRQWTSLYFRDKCNLVRVRTDAPTHKLLLVEEKKTEDVAREWFDQRIRSSLLSILYSVLLGLVDMEPGDYLLSHRKKMGAFASLMKATDRDSSFDLKQMYENVDTETPEIVTEIPWPPLNVNLQTPNQYKLHRVPCLFQPCPVAQITTRKTQKKFKNNRGKQKKKKNKNKNKPTKENNNQRSKERTSPVEFGT